LVESSSEFPRHPESEPNRNIMLKKIAILPFMISPSEDD
jgi:hypothetical protein